MRKNNLWALLPLLGVLLCAQTLQAQSRSSKSKQKKEDAPFVSKLWYGGGINLGGGAFNGTSLFSFGVSPMVGYKIIPSLSVGPRVAFSIASLKEAGFKATSLYTIETGAFLRLKVFRGLFLQGEVSNEWRQDPIGFGEKVSTTRFNQYLGAGWNFGGGGLGQEIGIFYNFAIANDINSFQQPFGYRLAFTYRF